LNLSKEIGSVGELG